MNENVKIFGAALDVSDNPTKLLIKLTYLNRLAQNLIDLSANFKDPYEGFVLHSKILSRGKFLKIGKFNILSWLRPKPNIQDLPLITLLEFQNFVNSGELKKYSIELERFVENKVFPSVPLMIGVDHSLTGGVLRAMAKRYGAVNMLVIVLDAHFDAIPASISLKLAKYAKAHKDEIHSLIDLDSIDENIEIKDTYNCASFIDYLIKENIVIPQNLIVFGCQDYPSKELKSKSDSNVQDYVNFYLDFEKKGVNFVSVNEDRKKMIEKFKEILQNVSTPYVYISLDVDVSAFKEVLATRFMNVIGIEKEVILDAAKEIKRYMKVRNCDLIGLDIMEVETYMLNKELKKSAKKDKTIELVDDFLEVIFDQVI
jgi:arginase family enzyme